MLVSMTGFGRGESRNDAIHVVAEIRSVNNRFLDINAKLPQSLSVYENNVKELIKQKVNRGRINLFVSLQTADEDQLGIQINDDVARACKKMLTELNDKLNLEGGVQLQHVLNFSEIFEPVNENQEDEELWRHTQDAVLQAIDGMNDMRVKEGTNLSSDLLERVGKIDHYIERIKQAAKEQMPNAYDGLKNRIQEILQRPDVDSERLEMEIAILADRLDVTEECVRFYSHTKMFRDLIKAPDRVGRRLNFLLQEMNREANTIGAKANNSDISHNVVFIKEEIERLREQIQNIE